jgi:hypothetical protein
MIYVHMYCINYKFPSKHFTIQSNDPGNIKHKQINNFTLKYLSM